MAKTKRHTGGGCVLLIDYEDEYDNKNKKINKRNQQKKKIRFKRFTSLSQL